MIAPDRHGGGTNAIAEDRTIESASGADRFVTHCALLGESREVVESAGLALDIDTPDHLDAAAEYTDLTLRG